MNYITENEKHLGGGFNTINPWGDPGTWSPEVWNKIIKDFNIESVVDIGCSKGYSTNYFSKKGVYSVGIEGGSNAINNSVFEGIIIKNDYTISSALNNNESFDLVWCCEFVEHVEEKYMYNFLHDFSSGKYIAMTFAESGQAGFHHVNCQSQEYWIEKIENLGYKCDKEYSEQLREIAKRTNKDTIFTHGGHLINILFFIKNEN